MSHAEWYEIKNLISENSQKSGFDLISYWNARNATGKSDIDLDFEKADALLLSNRFEDAFSAAQALTKKLKSIQRSRTDARTLIPYGYHLMARALYGARRYDESMTVYQWINTSYPFIRQVLFEKMWAAFKAGRVDIALGAIASQRSSFFSKYLPTESYLIQTYLLKKLCRDAELKEVADELKAYQEALTSGSLEDWASKDNTTAVLARVAKIKPKETDLTSMITPAERVSEQRQISEVLEKVYQKQKPLILNDLKTILAYQHLANVTDTKTVLQPVHKLKSRDELLAQDLEVWPADFKEEWLDEVGKHVLIGESLCKPDK
jgi:hypothetical protein